MGAGAPANMRAGARRAFAKNANAYAYIRTGACILNAAAHAFIFIGRMHMRIRMRILPPRAMHMCIRTRVFRCVHVICHIRVCAWRVWGVGTTVCKCAGAYYAYAYA